MRTMETTYCKKDDGYRLLTVSITKELNDQLEAIKHSVRAEGYEFNKSAFIRHLISVGIADHYANGRPIIK
jgi:hypothetical protein